MNSIYPELQKASANDLATLMVNEHPQTIAVVISVLEPELRGQVLKRLPEALQAETILRYANLSYIERSLVDKIVAILESQLITNPDDLCNLGGVGQVAEMLNHLDKNTATAVISRLEERDPLLAEEVCKLMFVFDDLERIEVKGLAVVFGEVPINAVALSLKVASDELRAKILSAFSPEQRKDIVLMLESLGPQRLVDVESCQQEIVNIARRLEIEGKITVARGGSEDALV